MSVFHGAFRNRNPFAVISNLGNPLGAAITIGEGNLYTRDYRQKPIVGLQTATHTKKGKPKFKEPIPPQRRKKDYPDNKILATTTMAPTFKKPFPPKRVKKSATNRKNKTQTKAKPKTVTQVLQKEVKSLKQAINAINSTHTYKKVATGSLKSLIGRCNHYSWEGSSLSQLEAFSANLRFYDPAAPGTLVTANPNTGTYARDVRFKNLYMKIMLRNNYQVPARVKIYLCKTKNDINDSVLTCYTNAITDQVINASTDETDALIYLTDIERMKEVWAIDCVADKVLEPGQEISANHSTGPFSFDPSHLDQNTDKYQKVFKAFEFMVRVEGVLGHDTAVTTEQTLLLAGVDVETTWKAVIEYNSGGADLEDIYISENRAQSFSNGGVCSLKPVADNIAYSIS